MISLLISCILFLTYERVFAATCINKNNIEWTSFNNQIYLNGERFNMKGLSWFGFETVNGNLYGLDKHNMDWYFEWMIDRGFNAIRMPFASDFLNNGGWNSYISAVMAAGEYGIFIMLDMHSKTIGSYQDGLDTINKATEIETWRTLAEKLVSAGAWNIMFVDVFNEPHDVSNDEWGEWLDFCESVAEAVWSEGLDALIAVEGTNWDCQSEYSCSWGENLIGVKNKGLTFSASKSNKFVWSPHVYGGDVTGNWNYKISEWEAHWGYLIDNNMDQAAIVMGEFGTKYTGSMIGWLDSLIDYMISLDQRNHFYWCLNPNSGDTGGLLQDDWTTEQSEKLAALATLQPSPSTISVSTSQICVSGLGDSATAPSGNSNSSPTPKPTAKPTSGSSSSGGSILIKQNDNTNVWWMAIEFPNNDNSAITKLEFRDSNHNSWVSGTYEAWGSGAYSFEANGAAISGSQHFRVTTSAGTATSWNVFSGISAGSTAYIALPGSSYTEEEEHSTINLSGAALAAIIICVLFCVLCIGFGAWYYKRHYYRLNKGQASFETTAGDTPEPPTNANTDTNGNGENVDDEVEVEMNVEPEVEQDGQTVTHQ